MKRTQMNINNYLIKQQPRATAFLNKKLEIVYASNQWINSFLFYRQENKNNRFRYIFTCSIQCVWASGGYF